jgi:hypothetical protein
MTMPKIEQSKIPASVAAEATAAKRPHRPRWLRLAVLLGATVAVAGVVVTAILLTGGASSDGQSVSEMVMKAWATGEQTDIDAVYADNVRMVVEGETLAETREEITSVITVAIRIGNTYQQVGPVSEYVATDGDLYIATLVEVVGTAHPAGDPIVGFYRVRDGKVTRHVFIDAEHY